MKVNNLFKLILSAFIACVSLIISMQVFAKNITLYEQPKAGAKVVGQADLSAGIIPIFSQKNGDWIKIADPRNGNVGWVKAKAISTDGGAVIFSQRILENDHGAQTIQSIQIGNAAKPTKEQLKQMEEIKKRQQAAQDNIEKSMNNMIKNMNQFFEYQWERIKADSDFFPAEMPVYVVPVQQKAETKVDSSAAKTAGAKQKSDKGRLNN